MNWPTATLLLAAAQAQAQPAAALPSPAAAYRAPAVWNPVAAYITAGQDEPGYRSWYRRAAWRPYHVTAFHNYLVQSGVAGVVPTWQLLRTATSWQRCGGEPFEVPPTNEWPHIVQTLRYVHGYVVPAIGPVEAVSGYRNPGLNVCAGGAPQSAHKSYSAIDLVPLRPTSREQLIRTLCGVHGRGGNAYGVGLGFYAFLRFHVDTTKFRRWGVGSSPDCPPIIQPEDFATVAHQPQDQPQAQPASADPAAAVVSVTSAPEPVVDPQQPQQQPQP
jgi:hypothetical protein